MTLKSKELPQIAHFMQTAIDYLSLIYACLNHFIVLFAIFTSINITGTSVRTPTIVARAAGLCVPKREIATATASSKKFDAPIILAGAAISCGSFNFLLEK
jgi:hypothetical protein